MSSPVPAVSPEDIQSITLTRTGFGFVLKAFHTPRHADVALKLLTSKNTTDRDLKALLEEVAATPHVQCERLLPCIGIYRFRGLIGVVTEWMHHGSLHSLIHEHVLYPNLPFPLCLRILTDVAEGLSHLHGLDPPVLHHSLKPSNVLLDLEYRAKISDYGLPTWRSQQLRSLLQKCNKSCWDLLYLSPEILQGGSFSQEGDIYSFGKMCWETLSRQRPLEDKKTLLEGVTAVCNGMRPRVELAFIPNSLPDRNKLLQLITLCWHQEPSYRPSAADCTAVLQDILNTFRKEIISDAIYELIHVKDCATNAAKSPISHGLEMDLRNLEVLSPQNYNTPNKKISLEAQSLPDIHLESNTHRKENDAKEALFANSTPPNMTLGTGRPVYSSKRSSCPPSLPTQITPGPCGKGTSRSRRKSEGWQPPPPVQGPDDSPSHEVCCKGNCCTILVCGRETILGFMTEGRLNHLLDVLRSQQILSRTDYEVITSFPTVTSRSRVLLDVCLSLGESAAQTVVAVLSASKGSPLARGLRTNAVN